MIQTWDKRLRCIFNILKLDLTARLCQHPLALTCYRVWLTYQALNMKKYKLYDFDKLPIQDLMLTMGNCPPLKDSSQSPGPRDHRKNTLNSKRLNIKRLHL